MGPLRCISSSLLCAGVLASAGYCAYRYGPWYAQSGDDSPGTASDLTAANACEGCCNGLASSCDLRVNEVLFPMVHNAMSSRNDLFAAYNNIESLERALVAGYRGLMLDSCICDGTSIGQEAQNIIRGEGDKGESYLGFCHTTCLAGVRDPAKVLGNIKTFLDVNRNEVLMIEFEVIDGSLTQLHSAIDESGLDQYVYTRSEGTATGEWPTLQSLIDANTRLIIFAHGDGMDYCCESDTCPEGMFYTYDHIEQTNWNDATCDVMGEDFDSKIDFFLMNHWMNEPETDLPFEGNADEFNSFNSLLERFKLCTERMPNIVAVDFWSIGDVLDFVKEVNQNKAGGSTTASETMPAIEEGGEN
ncbi:hypothetical protein ACHAW5_006470 [Stephanodiscus triporus]|uniref:Uncharacterized protein n=1 Tax=Stephanodiscus triporus TaxID=2934178 RepID=A0ABD3NTS5_9STRA